MTPPSNAVVILDAVRTPLGAVRGALAEMHPTALLGAALEGLAARTGVAAHDVGEVVAGCVEQVGGQGGNVARGAVFAARWPLTVGATTVDRGTTSGLAALRFAHALVASGQAPVVVAAAVDAPSVVPAGAAAMGRHPYGRPWGALPSTPPLVPPGIAAERLGVSRRDQDAWAARSVERVVAATEAHRFDDEVVAVAGRRLDELPPTRTADPVRLAALPPAFDTDGSVTAGNFAPLADGAVAVVVADASWTARRGLQPLAAIRAIQLASGAPDDLASPAVAAAAAVLRLGGGLLPATAEVPESSAALAVSVRQAIGLDPAAVNPTGGALALGEPPGASDLRTLVTLVHRMARDGASSGLCVAAGLGLGAAVLLGSPGGSLG